MMRSVLVASAWLLSLSACGPPAVQSTPFEPAQPVEASITNVEDSQYVPPQLVEEPEPPPPEEPDEFAAPADVAAPPDDAAVTASGLAIKVLTAGDGSGTTPGLNDTVEVHYTGWTTDGKMFDSSVKRNRVGRFQLTKVIAGWTEGMQLVELKSKVRMWIPEDLAYKGRKGAPQGMLVFDIELLSITVVPKPPNDVAAPPKNARRTKGVFFRVLTAGTGKKRPRAWDKVEVHYTGWTTDGKMFDSSIERNQPASFAVDGVIAGWTHVLQKMRVGDKWRTWIPKKLAYDGKPGRPEGMLVFDIELLSIDEQPRPPRAPRNVRRPPKKAKRTTSGLAYRFLRRKTRKGPTINADDKVEVHYSGWTTDGKLFDSSITREKPMTFSPKHMIPGFREGLTLMRAGDKTRLWIPEELAYKGQLGKPEGMLVFEVEVLSVQVALLPEHSQHNGMPAKAPMR